MKNAKEILNWYIMSGISDICADEPFVVLSTNIPQPVPSFPTQSAPAQAKRPATTVLAQEGAAACKNAEELCKQAQTLDDLKAIVENFEGCALKFSANSTVFGYGNPQAELMLIGEAPGADEDRIGEPFVGRCGQLLTKMLKAINIEREDCYITNILPWRPPGNRTPTDGEIAVCLPFLKRQIELVKPKIIFLLGGSAANTVLDCNDSISNLRGKCIDYTTAQSIVIPTISSFHPAYLLRSPAQKAKAWSDLLRLQKKMEIL